MVTIQQRLATIVIEAAMIGTTIPGFFLPIGVFCAIYIIQGILGEFIAFDFMQTNLPEAFTGLGFAFVVFILIIASSLSIYKCPGRWDIKIKLLFSKPSIPAVIWSIWVALVFIGHVIGFHYLTKPSISGLTFGLAVGIGLVGGTFGAIALPTILIFSGVFDKFFAKSSYKKIINPFRRSEGVWVLEALHFSLQVPFITGAMLITWLVWFKPLIYPERICIAIGIGIYAAFTLAFLGIKILLKKIAYSNNLEFLIAPECRRGYGKGEGTTKIVKMKLLERNDDIVLDEYKSGDLY